MPTQKLDGQRPRHAGNGQATSEKDIRERCRDHAREFEANTGGSTIRASPDPTFSRRSQAARCSIHNFKPGRF